MDSIEGVVFGIDLSCVGPLQEVVTKYLFLESMAHKKAAYLLLA